MSGPSGETGYPKPGELNLVDDLMAKARRKSEEIDDNIIQYKIIVAFSMGGSIDTYYLFDRPVYAKELSAIGIKTKIDGSFIALSVSGNYNKKGLIVHEELDLYSSDHVDLFDHMWKLSKDELIKLTKTKHSLVNKDYNPGVTEDTRELTKLVNDGFKEAVENNKWHNVTNHWSASYQINI